MRVTLPVADERDYKRLVWRLHSLTYALTTKFLEDKASRKKILGLMDKWAGEMLEFAGCPDDLCYDKGKGCVPCSDQPARKA